MTEEIHSPIRLEVTQNVPEGQKCSSLLCGRPAKYDVSGSPHSNRREYKCEICCHRGGWLNRWTPLESEETDAVREARRNDPELMLKDLRAEFIMRLIDAQNEIKALQADNKFLRRGWEAHQPQLCVSEKIKLAGRLWQWQNLAGELAHAIITGNNHGYGLKIGEEAVAKHKKLIEEDSNQPTYGIGE